MALEINFKRLFRHKPVLGVLSWVKFAALAATLGGCSVSVPISGLVDMTPLGSVQRADASAKAQEEPEANSIDMVSISTVPPEAHVAPKRASAKSDLLLRRYLAPSDLAHARPALERALGSLQPVRSIAWSNPATGASGAFIPVNGAGQSGCRSFRSVIRGKSEPAGQALLGRACRQADGGWDLRELTPETTAG